MSESRPGYVKAIDYLQRLADCGAPTDHELVTDHSRCPEFWAECKEVPVQENPAGRSPDIRENPRAGDADRDAVLLRLREAHVKGHIDIGEHNVRVEKALAAVEKQELPRLLTDLPSTSTPALIQGEWARDRKPARTRKPSMPSMTARFAAGAFLAAMYGTFYVIDAVNKGMPYHHFFANAGGGFTFVLALVACVLSIVMASCDWGD